jgi:hypothetical protein
MFKYAILFFISFPRSIKDLKVIVLNKPQRHRAHGEMHREKFE